MILNSQQNRIELVTRPVVDQWLDKCKFTCKICSKEFTSRQVAFKHVGASHNMDMASYITAHGYMLSQRTHFKCSKCNSDVLHERNVMTNHLLKCQKITPQEYFDTYVKTLMSDICAQMKPPPQAPREWGKSGPFDDWIFAQKFSCVLCPDKFKFPSQLSHHLRGRHSLGKEEYQELKRAMPKMPVKEHRCQLCYRSGHSRINVSFL